MRTLLLVIGASLFLTACGGAGLGTSSAKLDIKVGGKASTLTVKSGAVSYGNVISTAPGKPNIQTFAHTIYIANYEMETSDPGWMRKPLSAADQMRVDIQLTGEEGTKEDSSFKVATYSAKADKFNSVRFVRINAFADGKQTETDFDTSFSHEKMNGEVKITSVTADTVSGEVNLTEGDKSIKGTFTAKLPKKKT
jgi:hypothetical protein